MKEEAKYVAEARKKGIPINHEGRKERFEKSLISTSKTEEERLDWAEEMMIDQWSGQTTSVPGTTQGTPPQRSPQCH